MNISVTDMQIFIFLTIAILGAVSSVAGYYDYLSLGLITDLINTAKIEAEHAKCHYVIQEMHSYLGREGSPTEFPPVGTPEFIELAEIYLMMGLESSLFDQRLEFIRFFTDCFREFHLPTLTFEYYARMILSEPTKKLDQLDVLKSGAMSSLAAIDKMEEPISKEMISQALDMEVPVRPLSYCRIFAKNLKKIYSKGSVRQLRDEDVIDLLIKAKASIVHSRDLGKIIWISNCMIMFNQMTLSVEYYGQLFDDLNDSPPECLSDIYGGVFGYDQEMERDEDFPTKAILSAAISQFDDDEPSACVSMALNMIKRIHPNERFDEVSPRLYERLIKILKFGRLEWKKSWQIQNEIIFRDCIEKLVEIYDTLAVTYDETQSEDDSD